ncbi:MAG: N-6 DNA methylase, partial [Nanoarchaeota archaeon]
LVESDIYLKAKGENESLKLYGQEPHKTGWRLCNLALPINGKFDSVIETGDALTMPAFVENNCLTHFDRVVTVPPFSKKNWGYEIVKNDAFGRFRYGVPPKGTGDFAYLQHSIATLNEHGKLVTVAPAGMMFRGGAEGSIRKGIVRSDLIEAIIALPPGIFAHTSIPTYIIVINMEKSADRENSVLFIAADKKFHNDKRTTSLEEEDVAKVISSYKEYSDIEKYCRVVNVSEIAENDFNLSMSLYVDTSPEIETVDIDNALNRIIKIESRREIIRSELSKALETLRNFD